MLEHEFLEGFVGHIFSTPFCHRKRLWVFFDCITFDTMWMGPRYHRGLGHIEQTGLKNRSQLMKKTQNLVGSLLLALFVSCNFTEEIHLKEDGSGKISIHFDGSQMMAMAGDQLGQSGEKAVDSTIAFKVFLEGNKDSISQLPTEQQARLQRLEPFSMRVLMQPVEGRMMFDLFRDFDRINEVDDAFNVFQDASAFGPMASQDDDALSPDQATEVSYSYGTNQFKRSVQVVDSVLFQKSLDSLQGVEMFLSGSTYTLKYHFPRRVKSTSLEGATFSGDGRTLTYELDFLDWIKNPSLLDLEVVLEE